MRKQALYVRNTYSIPGLYQPVHHNQDTSDLPQLLPQYHPSGSESRKYEPAHFLLSISMNYVRKRLNWTSYIRHFYFTTAGKKSLPFFIEKQNFLYYSPWETQRKNVVCDTSRIFAACRAEIFPLYHWPRISSNDSGFCLGRAPKRTPRACAAAMPSACLARINSRSVCAT